MISFNLFLRKGFLPDCICFLVLALLLGLNGCANRYFEPPCDQYCITDELIFSEAWYICYKRGISCMQGKCLEYARDEFLRAIHKKKRDAIWVSTYGMHRMPEYFPNRELGIVYYYLGDFDNALKYLQISLEYFESAKAKYYINQVRKEKLLLIKEDIESPRLFLDSFPRSIAAPSLVLSGLAMDDTFVANIMIRVNREEPLSLLELSQSLFYPFQQKIHLQSGFNEITIKVTDLLGKEKEQKFKLLVDQEGPIIYFVEPEGNDFYSQSPVQGLLYDPSGIKQFYLNGKKVELIRVESYKASDVEVSYQIYYFKYRLSIEEWQKGVLHYQAEDSLQNITSGIITFLKEEKQNQVQQVSSLHHGHIRIAMAQKISHTDLGGKPSFYQVAKRRELDPIQIKITQIPQETFEEEISPQIEILAYNQIREVYMNEQPILSIYGLSFAKLFASIFKKYLGKRREGKFLFPRMIKLKEGENTIKIKVVDDFGNIWEKSILVIKRVKQIHKLDERWRIAIPLIYNNNEEKSLHRKNKLLTYQLIKAFINQSRFKIIDLENIPMLMREKNLHEYIGSPLLGLPKAYRIWIDAFLLAYFQETKDSFTLLASLIDLDTGEILATKDVFEKIDPIGPLEIAWEEDLREHTFQNCCALAAKFKNHFPLCEGKVIHLTEEELDTSICKNDGLKKGMKLIVYEDLDKEEDFKIMGEAKVKEVLEKYSQAEPLESWEVSDIKDISKTWLVMTR